MGYIETLVDGRDLIHALHGKLPNGGLGRGYCQFLREAEGDETEE